MFYSNKIEKIKLKSNVELKIKMQNDTFILNLSNEHLGLRSRNLLTNL